MIARIRTAWIAILIMALVALLAVQDARMQSLSNQPRVEIREGQPYIQRSCPFTNLNVSVGGYINVINPSTTTSLYTVEINYEPLPPEFTIRETGACIFNATGGPFPVPGHNMETPGVIHINEIPPGTTYRIYYWFNSTPVDDIRTYGFPGILTAGESVYAGDPVGGLTQLRICIDWRTLEYYLEKPVDGRKNFTIAICLYNTGKDDLRDIRFKKQLPASDRAGESYVWFAVSDASYRSSAGSIPETRFAPGPTNAIDIGITGGDGILKPGESLEIVITGRFVQKYPAGGDRERLFVSLRPAYFGFTTTAPGVSFLGSRIRNGTAGWFSAGGDAQINQERGYDDVSQKWEFSVGASNPGDISYTDLDFDVYRCPDSARPDYRNAVEAGPIYSQSPEYILGPSSSYDTGNVSLPEPHMIVETPWPCGDDGQKPGGLPADAGILLPGNNPWMTVNVNDSRMEEAIRGALNNTSAGGGWPDIIRNDTGVDDGRGMPVPVPTAEATDIGLLPLAIVLALAIAVIGLAWLLAMIRRKKK